MHSVLFVAAPSPPEEDWKTFTERVDRKIGVSEDVLRLAENVWLVRATKTLAPLAQLISDAESLGLSYGTLQFDREPEWLPAGFDPKTTLDRSAKT